MRGSPVQVRPGALLITEQVAVSWLPVFLIYNHLVSHLHHNEGPESCRHPRYASDKSMKLSHQRYKGPLIILHYNETISFYLFSIINFHSFLNHLIFHHACTDWMNSHNQFPLSIIILNLMQTHSEIFLRP